LGGDRYRLLVDTGIGVTVVSSLVGARADVEWSDDTFTARRMSGQTISSPLVQLPGAKLGGYTVDAHVACVADLGQVDGPDGFAGILGLDFFDDHTITIDPDASSLTVPPADGFPTAGGYEIPLDVRRDSVSVDPFATLVLPSGREVCVEIDTGSDNLILDTRFMPDCGVQAHDPDVITKTGTDETGYRWTRHWATVAGEVYLASAPKTAQAAARSSSRTSFTTASWAPTTCSATASASTSPGPGWSLILVADLPRVGTGGAGRPRRAPVGSPHCPRHDRMLAIAAGLVTYRSARSAARKRVGT